MALVRVTDLTYRYPQTAVPALQNISFSVEPGEFVAVIGANDAGKSTLCYALTGYVPHFFHGQMDGSVQLAGLETRERPLAELVTQAGLVFQNPATQMSGVRDTVRGEVGFGLENLGVPRAEMHPRIDEALAITGTTDLAERHPRELSGGQQQRVALAAMLAMRPQLLVLDEPTAQLDPVGSRELFAALQRLNALGYGRAGSGLTLNLVFNPQGPSLPPSQSALQADYARELYAQFGIVFNQLFVLANMPIQRFGSTLISKGSFADYLRLLRENFAAANLEQVMCHTLLQEFFWYWQGHLQPHNQLLLLPDHNIPREYSFHNQQGLSPYHFQ